jgi:nucleotide-binding universal stress UspA family protein
VHPSEVERREVLEYLSAHADRLRSRGLTVECVLREGRGADAIIDEAVRRDAGLIAMTTHGRSEFGRLILGSVADAVLQRASCPTLLLRASETRS